MEIRYMFILLPLLLVACEKDIEIDYREVDPLYVVQAAVMETGTTVRITKTRSMTDNDTDMSVEDAHVTVSSGDSICDTLVYNMRGYYISALRGIPGTEYRVDINIGDKHFSSRSTMQRKPQVNSFRFVWKKILGTRVLFADLRLQDIPGETNYYFMHIYRNGVGYRWAVMRDTGNPGKELQQLFNCMTEDTDEDDSDFLHEGDRIYVETRSIDRSAYDYLFSMQQMDGAVTNPVMNFTGGCLGYFSAYSRVTCDYVFRLADAEEE